MTFLKLASVFFMLFIGGLTIAFAQQSSDITIQWTGKNSTVQLRNGKTIRYPNAQYVSVYEEGEVFFQIDVPGRVTTVKEEQVTFMVADSATALVLRALSIPQPVNIRLVHLYNKGVITRFYIPVLRQNSSGEWNRISTLKLNYTLSSEPERAPASTVRLPSMGNARTTAAGGSVLNTGDWYKLAVSENGVYRIDPTYLASIGINPASIDPNKIQIYGNGGGMLPQANSDSRYDDLVENSIYLNEDGNGVFDHGDYILFYGESPHVWNYNSANQKFDHTLDLYSNQNFYFLTYGQNYSKQIGDVGSIGGTGQTVSTYNEHLYSETDQYNFIDSGREWYGDVFKQFSTSRNYTFNVNGIVNSGANKLTASVVGRSLSSSTSFSYTVNGTANGTQALTAIQVDNGNNHPAVGVNSVMNATLTTINGPVAVVGMNFNLGGSNSSVANLNFLELNFERNLSLYGTQTLFRSIKSTDFSSCSYRINTDGKSVQVWDITDPHNILRQQYVVSGANIEFGASSSILREYIVLTGSSFITPAFIEKTANQNLHGVLAGNVPDMIIVAYPAFINQAKKLASFRLSNDGITSYIVTPAQIYNEFSSGKQDVSAIRDYVKMVYDRGSGTNTLKYLLFFGNGTFDYKNIQNHNDNFVPTYQSRESLDPITSQNSDDFFGFMDANEGTWVEPTPTIPADVYSIDVAVGRLNVRSATDAEIIVAKLINYSRTSASSNGKWKNKLTLIADDVDTIFMDYAEILSSSVASSAKQMNVNKIYIDAYQQESTPGGETATLVNDAINRDISEGTLLWNYIGHGGTTVLAQEAVVTINSINNWTNINRLPFFVTATCDFGRYDSPGLKSGAEQILLSATGGSCSNFTSTRVVYANNNHTINNALYNYFFQVNPDGSHPTIGEIVRLAKNQGVAGVYNRNYTLLGDPSLTIIYPKDELVITTVNAKPISSDSDTLKALSKITIEGAVQDFNGNLVTGFNGQTNVIVFDKPVNLTTLGLDGNAPKPYKLQSNFIFDGNASINNGIFKLSFIVPKDISYQYDFGKISMYGSNSNGSVDAGGYYSNIVIGGSNPNAPADNTPPKVKLYLNDPSFASGGLARNNPVFFADVSDENGINVSAAGIGHEITLTLNGSKDVIILNKYYSASLDDYTKGKVQYPFNNLAPGNYSLHFKVWDTYNNSSEDVLEFTVENTSKIALDHVLNYPNPFSTHTTFHFDHNRYGDDLMVQIQIYTVSGILIKTLDETFYSSPAHISGLPWNGLDDYGDKIGRGVYVYKLKIRSLNDGSTIQAYQKLVLLN